MKRILLAAAALTLLVGAGTLSADDSFWQGTFDGNYTGIWNGTIHDNPDEDQIPHFSGEWFFDDTAEHGTLYGVVSTPYPGYYIVSSGIIYNDEGIIGSWDGYFDLTYDGVPGSRAEGKWCLIDATIGGKWHGERILP